MAKEQSIKDNMFFSKILCLLGAIILVAAQPISASELRVEAKSFIVTELDGTVIISKDAHTIRPIASITKLLIAEQIEPIMRGGDEVILQRSDLASKHTSLKVDSKFSQAELLDLSLVASNNQAIYALTRANNSSRMIKAVNDRAASRGLYSISIEEPSGLSVRNVANAADLAKFAILMNDTTLGWASTRPNAQLGKIVVKSTNPLLNKPGWHFTVSKTGFINASGGCLVSILEVSGRLVAVVILGSTNTATRWADLKKIKTFVTLTYPDKVYKSMLEVAL